MMWSNIKPKGGGGGNSANFFLKFFLLSGMISVLYCTFLLTYITFPKSCEIQAQSIPKIIENIDIITLYQVIIYTNSNKANKYIRSNFLSC